MVVLVAMLVLRLGFDWFVLPDRHREDWGTRCKESTIQMAQQLKEAPNLYIYKNTALQYTNSFYLTAVRQELLERRFEGFQPGDYIIVDPETYPSAEWDPVGEFFMRFDKKRLQTGRIREPVEKREE
ncbi:MAG: hypothetical protein IPJ40_12795 [Saprospirales bacterium]|nr:hypothetical protein [Saprospirales bacterium]